MKKKSKLNTYQKIMVALVSGIMGLHVISECRTILTITYPTPDGGMVGASYKVWVWELD